MLRKGIDRMLQQAVNFASQDNCTLFGETEYTVRDELPLDLTRL
mgnify:CR=1 FL=1